MRSSACMSPDDETPTTLPALEAEWEAEPPAPSWRHWGCERAGEDVRAIDRPPCLACLYEAEDATREGLQALEAALRRLTAAVALVPAAAPPDPPRRGRRTTREFVRLALLKIAQKLE